MPRINVRGAGREVFAVWTPVMEGGISSEYLTDTNCFELVERTVSSKYSTPFAATLFPVDSSISAQNSSKEKIFTVWNDRAQAGAVHYDGTIKLLVDRRIMTTD